MPGQITTDKVELIAERPDGQRTAFQLEPESSVLVGKSNSCGLRLVGAAISPLHCLISLEEGTLWVQDWQSAEGTLVNGQQIDTRTSVAPGDRIAIGEYQLYHGSGSTTAPEATPTAARCHTIDEESPDARAIENTSAYDGHADEYSAADEPTAALFADEHSPHGDQAHLPGANPAFEAEGPPTVGHPRDGSTSYDDVESSIDEDYGVPSLDSLWPSAGDALPLDPALFEAETYDAETVALLKDEIDDLQAAIADRDARLSELQDSTVPPTRSTNAADEIGDSAVLVARLDDLLVEAERSDERVRALEEMLQISEEANHAEQEERSQLEAWLVDIEQRIGQREAEQHAEVESLRRRLEQAHHERDRAERQLQQSAAAGKAPEGFEQALEQLRQQLIAQRQQNAELQQQLDSVQAERNGLVQRLENADSQQDQVLREERAAIAQERAKVSRLRFELSRELAALEEMPKQMTAEDREVAGRLQTLREHLREIHQHEQEAQRQHRESSLTHRVARLWKRVDQ